MSADTYNTFSYSLPQGLVTMYAQNALEILQAVGDLNTAALPLLLRADVVLTLSGVRAFDVYMDDPNDFLTAKEVSRLTELLQSYGLHLESQRSEYSTKSDEKFSYYLVNTSALKRIPAQYKLKAWIEPKAPYSFDRLMAWAYLVEKQIYAAIYSNELPNKWATDYWAPHNIRFGVLLGYPGEAIASLFDQTSESAQLIESTIAYYDIYHAAHPIYVFNSELKANQNIIDHQRLWSDILVKVYESKWHQAVKEDNRFRAQLKKLKAAND